MANTSVPTSETTLESTSAAAGAKSAVSSATIAGPLTNTSSTMTASSANAVVTRWSRRPSSAGHSVRITEEIGGSAQPAIPATTTSTASGASP